MAENLSVYLAWVISFLAHFHQQCGLAVSGAQVSCCICADSCNEKRVHHHP